jgi:hypothetical protein
MANMAVNGASYYALARDGLVQSAYAIVTAPVIYSTAAGTGGPLLWNSSTNKNAVLLYVTCPVSVVTTVAAALGITGAAGQTAAPGSTTAIDASGNLKVGGPASAMNVYRVGTPTNAGTFFLPLAYLHTGALTVDTQGNAMIPLEGSVVVPPNSWVSWAASATATTTVARLGMVWAELPL